MSDAIETFEDEATGIKAVVEYDPFDHESPRNFDGNAWVIVEPFGGGYTFGDEAENLGELEIDCPKCKGTGEGPDVDDPEYGKIASDCDECEGTGTKEADPITYFKVEQGAAVVLPVYRYEHGLCQYSASDFADPWDSGICGVAYLTKDSLKENFDGDEGKARECLDAELETLTDWANGSIYAYVIKDKNGDMLDSCCGFYGLEHAENEAKDNLAHCVKQAHKEAEAVRYWAERDIVTV